MPPKKELIITMKDEDQFLNYYNPEHKKLVGNIDCWRDR